MMDIDRLFEDWDDDEMSNRKYNVGDKFQVNGEDTLIIDKILGNELFFHDINENLSSGSVSISEFENDIETNFIIIL